MGLTASFALAGCESGPNLGGVGPQATLAPPAAEQAKTASIQIVPIIGAPDTVARELQSQISQGLTQNQIAVVPENTPSQYALRGYIVAARESSGTKVSYIWDITDSSGARAHRITGEETAPGRTADPWAAVTPDFLRKISSATTSQVAAWMPRGASSAAAGVPIAGAASSAPTPVAQSTAPSLTRVAQPASAADANQATGSIGLTGPVSTLVPSVTGAPGDGSMSLTSAIQRELSKNGVQLARGATPQTYRVQGNVAMGQASNGKQSIQIDWNVIDPAGKKLGTVSQKNEVPTGSLDGAWGKTADAAAAAAAQGILKLLPNKNATN